MKIVQIHTLLSVGKFEESPTYQQIEKEIISAVNCIKYPVGADGFYLFNGKKQNGVVPIKNAFIQRLDDLGSVHIRASTIRAK